MDVRTGASPRNIDWPTDWRLEKDIYSRSGAVYIARLSLTEIKVSHVKLVICVPVKFPYVSFGLRLP